MKTKEIIEKILKEVWLTNKLLKEAKKIFPLEIERTKQAIEKSLSFKEEKSKGDVFVEHIQNHLDKGDRGLKLYKIPEGVVGCAICGKTVDEIYKEYIKQEGGDNEII